MEFRLPTMNADEMARVLIAEIQNANYELRDAEKWGFTYEETQSLRKEVCTLERIAEAFGMVEE